jgi:hypothetical protein
MYLTGTSYSANVFRASWNLDLVSNFSMLVTVIVKPLPKGRIMETCPEFIGEFVDDARILTLQRSRPLLRLVGD